VSITANADSGNSRVLVSTITATRVWPMVAGSPRYYEPDSGGGLSNSAIGRHRCQVPVNRRPIWALTQF
jgi:hypothetical protein